MQFLKQTNGLTFYYPYYRNAGTTTVLSPLTSIVYLWDEPGGDLTLLWQPENFDVNPKELPLNKVNRQNHNIFVTLFSSTNQLYEQ